MRFPPYIPVVQGEATQLVMPVAPVPPPLFPRPCSLEVVEQDPRPRPLGMAYAVLALVVQVVLVDGEKGQVRLAPDQPLPGRKPQQLLDARYNHPTKTSGARAVDGVAT